MRRFAIAAALAAAAISAPVAGADIKIALIHGKTGALEAYAKQTETGLRLGLEYTTGGTMAINGNKIVLLTKDDQLTPYLPKWRFAEAYGDCKVDLAIRT